MIPKPTNYKGTKTPIPKGQKRCILEDCNCNGRLEVAHVFGASNRNFASYYNAVEWCCSFHHRDNVYGIDGQNSEMSDILKADHQERIERIWISEGLTPEEARRRWTKVELIMNYRGDEIG